MGRTKSKTIDRFRLEHKATYCVKVKAKCPWCECYHIILVGRKPKLLIRTFCPRCKQKVDNNEE